MNRYLRRLERFRKPFAARRSGGLLVDTHAKLDAAGTPQDVKDIRAKNAGHKKRTADKWNQ